jgi:flagellar biosynthesis protein FlhF
MQIKTFRAKTMPQALDLVRRELGPEAMVLHTRELNGGLIGRILCGRAYEIAATTSPAKAVNRHEPEEVFFEPSRPALDNAPVTSPWRGRLGREIEPAQHTATPNHFPHSPFATPHSSVSPQVAEFQSLVEQLRNRGDSAPQRAMPPELFEHYTDLIEADVEEEIARDLIDRLRREPTADLLDPSANRLRLGALVESELSVAGPIRIEPAAGRVVALVGPTGVGKTTTIAKLAANYRLRENRRVGLITVDTYRIAAVEQLRTYADIIDLPMEVVSTPREMRGAVDRMRDFDLVLMDTAGRSPRDEVRIRELRAMLAEAGPHEVHLVLSAAASARSLAAAAEKFAPAGVTAAIVTKLDEATGLGNLLTLARRSGLPFSYLTDGQNVPDDIAVAESRGLAQVILNQSR